MKLTINGRIVPDWWAKNDDGCFNHFNPVDEILCFADKGFSEITGTEPVYNLVINDLNKSKDLFVDGVLMKIKDGFISEFHNLVEIAQCFPCG